LQARRIAVCSRSKLKGEEAMPKTDGYKLATYQASDGPRAGLVIEDKVYDAAALTRTRAYASVLGILADWRAAEAVLRQAAASVGKGKPGGKAKNRPLAKTRLLAPVRFPSAIYCAGSNYADHAAEMAARDGRGPPPDPRTLGLKAWHFIKAAPAIAHPGAPAQHSRLWREDGWENGACGRDRPHRQGRAPGQSAQLCRRLHHRQRSFGARPRSPRQYARRLAVQMGLDQTQDVRWLVSARALDRAGERHRRPAKT